jgi:hypothetical protein
MGMSHGHSTVKQQQLTFSSFQPSITEPRFTVLVRLIHAETAFFLRFSSKLTIRSGPGISKQMAMSIVGKIHRMRILVEVIT